MTKELKQEFTLRITQANKNFLNGKLNLANPYPIKEQEIICPIEATTVTNKEFFKYLPAFKISIATK